MATESARGRNANRWARWMAKQCLRLFKGTPMPDLALPCLQPGRTQLERISISGE
jgi:hypothetical protein